MKCKTHIWMKFHTHNMKIHEDTFEKITPQATLAGAFQNGWRNAAW